MLDFLFRIFKKKEEKKEEPKKLLIVRENELESVLNNFISIKEEEMKNSLISIYKSIESKVKNLENSLNNLKNETISLPDKQTETLVNAKKKDFLEKMELAINAFKYENLTSSDLSKIISFYREFYEKLREVNAISLKDFLTIKNYFSSSGNVLENFKILIEEVEKQKRIFYSEESNKVLDIKKQVYDYLWLKKEIENLKDSIQKENEKIAQKEKEIEVKKEEIVRLENSEELRKLRELEKEKSKIYFREKELSSICIEKASTIEHILKKIRRKVNEKDSAIIEKFIYSPFDAVISHDMQGFLKKLLENAKSLDLKEEELRKLQNVIEENIFDKVSSEYLQLEKRLREIESEIEKISVIKEKLRIENEIKSISFDVDEERKSLEKMKRKLEELENLRENLKSSLESEISEFLKREVKIIQPM